MLVGLTFVHGMGVVMLMPFAGDGASLSPVPAAWSAPNCDADGDLHDKDNRKCNGDDPDDSDPCNPDDTALACVPGSGGGGDLGSAIALECLLGASWGDSSTDTIKGDRLPLTDPDLGVSVYSDAVDKVNCGISGPSTPWPIHLGMGVKGRPENSVRKVDVDFGESTWGNYPYPGIKPMSDYLPEYLFRPAAEDPDPDYAGWPDMDDMEPIRINVRPYRDDPNQTEDGIHLLPWKSVPYEMGMHFNIPGTQRFSVSIASLWYEGNETFTGISCESGHELDILAGAPEPGGAMRDVSVYLWLDGDGDGFADGYTVTTGDITPLQHENGDYKEGPPTVNPGSRYAAVCSSVGPEVCGNPKAPSNCNFLGYVKVGFTMHAVVK
ncbi:hypothetical protein ACFL1J_04525 [Pseudomonadota bacterium]